MLWRKMLRELWDNKTANLACIAVIVIGLMIFTSISMVMTNLEQAKERFYQESRVADGFADVVGIPLSQISHLQKIEGIEKIQGQLVKDVRVFQPDKQESVYLRLVSFDPNQPKGINQLTVMSGHPIAGEGEMIWVDVNFFRANALAIDGEIPVIIGGKKVELKIAGTAQHPAYVYAVQSVQNPYSTAETFGVAYVPNSLMKSLFQTDSIANQLVFTLAKGTSYQAVEEKIKPRLEPYGLKSIYPRKDQFSDAILTNELKSLRATGNSMPPLFLVVAAAILYIMLKRMIDQQRGQIGVMKAFGYTELEVMTHYLSYSAIIGAVGGVLGGLAGIALSKPLTNLYNDVFNLPYMNQNFSLHWVLISIVISVGFSLLAGWFGCRGILRLRPAESMRAAPPPSADKTWLEHVEFVWSMYTVQGKMAVRNIARNKQRSFFTFIGVLFSFSMMVTFWSLVESTDRMITGQFMKVETYDVKVSFLSPLPAASVVNELSHMDGMKRVEPLLEAPATVKHNWHKKDLMITGISTDSQIFHLFDEQNKPLRLSDSGILLSRLLAEQLDVSMGSKLTVESVWAKESPVTFEVVGIIESFGLQAYTSLDTLQAKYHQGKMASGAVFLIESSHLDNFLAKANEMKMVSSVEDRSSMIANLYKQIETLQATIWIMVGFATISGFAILYNTSLISFSERKRELASLLVLGFTPREVQQIITTELWLIGGVAMLFGIPFAWQMKYGVQESMESDMYSVGIHISGESYLLAAVATVIAVLVAQFIMLKKIEKLSLVEVLKDRE
ncbi:ABC transporter permease [Brevibacillus sp. SYSU BS000544]|uniref:ABC transporter permease n=1 Tax=Brevibacillus sp. SYSU BS000544 TaxID=3416443 RepID=UPI003CE4F76B